MCMHTQQTLNKHTCIIHKTHLHVLAITDIKRTRMQTQKDVHMYKYAVCIIHKHAYTKKITSYSQCTQTTCIHTHT